MDSTVHQVAWFNGWTVIHLGVWLFAGFLAWHVAGGRKYLGQTLLVCLGLALAWEVIELVLARLPVLWPLSESARNRWISDPLTVFIGAPVGWWLARTMERGRWRTAAP